MENDNSNKYNFLLPGNNGKAVLLIHGITGTPSEMRYIGRMLHKAGFTVFCNTLPRHCGTLGELKKVTWREIADACIEDFKRLKAEYNKVFIAGISMGALVALHIAHEFPEDVAGIIAFAPTLFYDGWALHKGKIVMETLWHLPFIRNRVNIREGWPYGLKDEYLRDNIERFYRNARAGEFDKKVVMFGSPFFPVACLYQHHLLTDVVKKELKHIKNPILIMHAREDDMTSIKNAQYLLSNIGSPDKNLIVLEDSYHMITIDNEKEKVASEAVKFVGRL